MVTRQFVAFRLLGTALLTVSCAPAFGCLNDRDTLAVEARQSPDVLRVITGRFERNPPLYYTMRIDREKAELANNPNLLDDYDDIAVAYDRIGDDDDAIRWIEKKHKLLPPYNPRNLGFKDAWYRYYANVGTFWVHRWVRHGADRSKIDEVVHARDCIAKGLDINPNAHFHREHYQLEVMNWMIDSKGKTLADYLANEDRKTAIVGLSGLIELGNAWESVDIFDALGSKLGQKEPALAGFATLRERELMAAGHSSFEDDTTGLRRYWSTGYEDGQFEKLRKEADDWQRRRTVYMMARLTAGRHPDTDPTFWNDWHDAGPPSIDPYFSPMQKLILLTMVAIGVVCVVAFVDRYRQSRRLRSG